MENEQEKSERAKIPEDVLYSDYGCLNCLWADVECKGGSKYAPEVVGTRLSHCFNYVYFD